jgi:nicotinamidase-related amidase
VQAFGPDEAAIYKPRWGAFYETPIEDHLRSRGVTTLVFCGCNFPNCPRTSIYEASERDFRIVIARDAISGLERQSRCVAVERADAHRLYLNSGMVISAHHFARRVD